MNTERQLHRIDEVRRIKERGHGCRGSVERSDVLPAAWFEGNGSRSRRGSRTALLRSIISLVLAVR